MRTMYVIIPSGYEGEILSLSECSLDEIKLTERKDAISLFETGKNGDYFLSEREDELYIVVDRKE